MIPIPPAALARAAAVEDTWLQAIVATGFIFLLAFMALLVAVALSEIFAACLGEDEDNEDG